MYLCLQKNRITIIPSFSSSDRTVGALLGLSIRSSNTVIISRSCFLSPCFLLFFCFASLAPQLCEIPLVGSCLCHLSGQYKVQLVFVVKTWSRFVPITVNGVASTVNCMISPYLRSWLLGSLGCMSALSCCWCFSSLLFSIAIVGGIARPCCWVLYNR